MRRFDEQVKEIKDVLRARIFRGDWLPGASIDKEDVRTEFQASVRVVRQALTDLAREGLILRKRHVGTFVSQNLPTATMTVLPRMHGLGVVSSMGQSGFLASTYMQALMNGLRDALLPPGQIGLFLNASCGKWNITDPPPLDPGRIDRQLQGLVAIELNNASFLNGLARSGVSLTAIDFAPPDRAFDSLMIDHLDAGYQATVHLLKLGHRKVAFIGEAPGGRNVDPAWQERLLGYQRAMAETGGDCPPQWICHTGRGIRQLPGVLAPFHRKHRPSAYVLATAGWFVRVHKVLAQAGASPGTVSIASADPGARENEQPDLASARVNMDMVGREAVRMLASRLACRAMPAMTLRYPVSFKSGTSARRP